MSHLYNNFKFRLYWRDRIVAGFSTLSGLKPTASKAFYEYLHDTPDRANDHSEQVFGAVTMQMGVCDDPAFYAWANEWFTQPFSSLDNLHPDEHRPEDVVIEMVDENGSVARAYHLSRARITESVFPGVSGDKDLPTAFDTIVLHNEGWSVI
ncbi:MAG: hypothetical protein EOP49_17880 [Sphingobacteriales bacterium]|nr:MAG: hypothetical protein EOP49_17880 [Sphingobacteriales bacterium]